MKSLVRIAGFLFLWNIYDTNAAIAEPYPVQVPQPGGGYEELIFRGGPEDHCFVNLTSPSDSLSAPVLLNQTNISSNTTLHSSAARAKHSAKHSTNRFLPPAGDTIRPSNLTFRQLVPPSIMANMVILVRFSDHHERILPTPSDIDILFNAVGGDPDLAPSGSVQDVFTYNSYGKFLLDSTVLGWVDLPKTEAYYAGGVSGYGTVKYLEALEYALDYLDNVLGINFGEFDADSDGFVDVVTLLHSGYAAEVAGTDEAGAGIDDRIWSHRWRLQSNNYWISRTGIQVDQYATGPSLWGLSGSVIGRIGVISHEIGHALKSTNLPDLYGTIEGNGVGSFDLMSNHWGFGDYDVSQHYPPLMSAWTKSEVGWLIAEVIEASGTYNIQASALSASAYRINLNDDNTEYLLIENRQPIGFDKYLPQGGLAIWHIDELASNLEGYPDQPNWPENGIHYKVALLQADGMYDLEQGNNFGDSGDLFHANSVQEIGPSTSNGGPFPNTDAYQSGVIRNSGIKIFNISEAAIDMSFSVQFLNIPPQKSLQTIFWDNNGATGNMFDVFSKKDITIYSLDIHVADPGQTLVEIFFKSGTHTTFENKPSAWTRLDPVAVNVQGVGRGIVTALDVGPIVLTGGERYAFYITLLKGKLRYTNGVGVGTLVASNEDLIIYEGVGKGGFFGNTYQERIWNGAMYYSV